MNDSDTLERIRNLAGEGCHKAMIVNKLGIAWGTLNRLIKDEDIEFPKAPNKPAANHPFRCGLKPSPYKVAVLKSKGEYKSNYIPRV